MILKLLIPVFILIVVEFYLIFKMAAFIGGLGTFALILAMIYLGFRVIKHQGRHLWGNVQKELAMGRMPQDSLLNALLIFIAGLLFIIPGFLSDIAAIFFLLPVIRNALINNVGALFKKNILNEMGNIKGSMGFKGKSNSNSDFKNSARDPNQIDAKWKIESDDKNLQ